MTSFAIFALIAFICATVTLIVFAIIRGGAKKIGLDQKFLDDEQAKALRDWHDSR